MSGNGIGSTPTNNLSHTQFSTSNAEVDTPATPRRSSSSRSQHPSANMPSPRASQDGTEMSVISRPPAAVTRSRTSLGGRSAPGASSNEVDRITDDVEQALDEIVNQPLPQHVNSPASLWQHITGRLQGAVGGAVTAGVTFGAFRGVGPIAEHTTSSEYGQQVATQMKSVLIGAAAAGVGNTLATMVLTPAAVALMSKLLGTSTALTPRSAEQMVPPGSPDRAEQIAGIKTAQARFGVDSLANILSGGASFSTAHGVRGGLTANAGLTPIAGYGAAAAASSAAGGFTAVVTQTLQAKSRIKVRGPGDQESIEDLFEHVSKPPVAIGTAVSGATQGFLGGRQGMQAARHLVSQVGQRAAIVGASTVAYGLTQAAIPAARHTLTEHGVSPELANSVATGGINAAGFAMVVIAYFTLLGKIAGTIPQRNPQQPGGAPRS
ncbi:hypothetical protein [Paraburkholderia flava]|uniref:hypothetical protein n=1 Tax=Paraburkholderia flava TaxID=2547393 RepID=UPI00105D42C0|nr:hypothetical protein [Paraburkholderia flava]